LRLHHVCPTLVAHTPTQAAAPVSYEAGALPTANARGLQLWTECELSGGLHLGTRVHDRAES
jgi:hypothetical protein